MLVIGATCMQCTHAHQMLVGARQGRYGKAGPTGSRVVMARTLGGRGAGGVQVGMMLMLFKRASAR